MLFRRQPRGKNLLNCMNWHAQWDWHPKGHWEYGDMKHSAQSNGGTINRRELMKLMGLGLTAAVLPCGMLAGARPVMAQGGEAASAMGDIITKTIDSTGERVPAIGMGSYLVFDTIPGDDRSHIREVIKRFYEGGGRVIDTSPLYGSGEISVGDFATAMSINDQLFIANKVWSTGDYLFDDSHAERSFEESRRRLWRRQFDVMQVHSLTNVAVIFPILQAWKKEGHVRYVGITHHEPPYFDLLADWITKGKPDFVQVHYSIFNRLAEKRILPAAADAGAAVLVNMPFEKARLFKLVEGHPLPDFAEEFGAENWAQFFLKWIISHPAVTVAIPATSNPDHASENIGALRGSLPDADMRERMVRHMESIPGFATLDQAPRYPGKKYEGLIARARANLKSRT
ncbi:MAG: aldo/keto reductase [Sedimenticolaceae bacterium]